MSWSTQMHFYVDLYGHNPHAKAGSRIPLAVWKELEPLLNGYEPMLTVTDTDSRAWLRRKSGDGWERIFGKHAPTPEQAVRNLIAKLTRGEA